MVYPYVKFQLCSIDHHGSIITIQKLIRIKEFNDENHLKADLYLRGISSVKHLIKKRFLIICELMYIE